MSDIEYWVAEPGGTPEGPYDLSTLRRMRDQGRIGAQTQICPDGGTAWQPASAVLGSVAAVSGASVGATSPPAAAAWDRGVGAASAVGREPLGFALPIVATVVGALFSPCFSGLILGIIALVQTSGANDSLARGDVQEFERKAGVARTCSIVTFVLSSLGCVAGIVWIVFVVIAGAVP